MMMASEKSFQQMKKEAEKEPRVGSGQVDGVQNEEGEEVPESTTLILHSFNSRQPKDTMPFTITDETRLLRFTLAGAVPGLSSISYQVSSSCYSSSFFLYPEWQARLETEDHSYK